MRISDWSSDVCSSDLFEVGVDLDVDQAAAFLDPGLFRRLVPELLRGQVLAPAQHRFARTGVLDLVLAAVAAGVVGGGVVVQASFGRLRVGVELFCTWMYWGAPDRIIKKKIKTHTAT